MKGSYRFLAVCLIILGIFFIAFGLWLFNEYEYSKPSACVIAALGSCLALCGIVFLLIINKNTDAKNEAPYISALLIRRDALDNVMDVYLFVKCLIVGGNITHVICHVEGRDYQYSFLTSSIEIRRCKYKEGIEPSIFEGHIEYHKDICNVSYKEHRIKNGFVS